MSNDIDNLKKQYQGKKILVVGLGIQGGGAGVARFFAELGAEVRVTDKKNEEDLKTSLEELKDLNIEYTLGGHKPEDFLEADIIFKGPSVPWSLKELVEAERRGIRIEMETSFFLSLVPSKNIIGVTGTRGKSTTSIMIYELLKKLGKKVYMAGNTPGVSTIALLKTIKPDDFIILELSSWQLSGFHKKRISPHIAVFTNFYPDHLNYYNDMDSYLFDKKAIYLNQTEDDYLIINEKFKDIIQDDDVKSQVVYFSEKDFPNNLNYLKGTHNQQNAAASFATLQVLGLTTPSLIETLSNFKGLSFRQQVVGQKDGIFFINDTTSTTPVATIMAIQTFGNKPLILLLGGQSKNLPHEELVNFLDNVRGIVLLKGSFTDEILPELQNKFNDKITPIANNMEEAVLKAYSLAQKVRAREPEVFIVLSPGATSFAGFKNEFERGQVFNEVVKKILSSP